MSSLFVDYGDGIWVVTSNKSTSIKKCAYPITEYCSENKKYIKIIIFGSYIFYLYAFGCFEDYSNWKASLIEFSLNYVVNCDSYADIHDILTH